MNPARWLQNSAQKWPKAPALFNGGTVVANYNEFALRAAAIARALKNTYNIRPGDHVAIFSKNTTQYLEALYAIWWIGAVVVPINSKLHPKEAAWVIKESCTKLVFTTTSHIDNLAADCPKVDIIGLQTQAFETLTKHLPLPRVHPTRDIDTIWLFYTSGTTGKPKGVMLSAGNLGSMIESYFQDVDVVTHDDAILYAAPMSHGAGLYNFMYVLHGARHVIPLSGGFDASEILVLSEKIKNVSTFLAPTMVRRLVDQARSLGVRGSGLKTVIYGGGPMYTVDIINAVNWMGPRFVQIYGQGECPMAISALSREEVADRTHPRWRERLASVGRAQSGMHVKIAKTSTKKIKGEILVSGPTVMKGYWRNGSASSDTLAGGWLHTGDIGTLDEDGYLTLHDRAKDVIISGGANIYPREVEEVLLQHIDVNEVAVIGRKSQEWGEDVVAFVSVSLGCIVSEAQLDNLCLEQIARFKRPKKYYFWEILPKNNYGKVLKSKLREWLDNT